jgi:cell division transport system permease protein
MTIAAISTVAISLLLLGGVQILGLVVSNVTSTIESKVEINAYLFDNATQNEISQLETDLSQMPEVQGVDFISKEEAYEIFKERYADQPQLWKQLPKDTLPASLRISLIDADDTEEVASRIDGAPGVEEVSFGGDVIRRLLRVNALLRSIALVMSLVLMIAAAALIANTIRLAIYARREEIGIMKLVGATNWFIRIPFILEGIFAALVGAIVSGAIVITLNSILFERIGENVIFLGPIFRFSTAEMGGVLLLLVAVGCLVGIIGSTMALRRFLEV